VGRPSTIVMGRVLQARPTSLASQYWFPSHSHSLISLQSTWAITLAWRCLALCVAVLIPEQLAGSFAATVGDDSTALVVLMLTGGATISAPARTWNIPHDSFVWPHCQLTATDTGRQCDNSRNNHAAKASTTRQEIEPETRHSSSQFQRGHGARRPDLGVASAQKLAACQLRSRILETLRWPALAMVRHRACSQQSSAGAHKMGDHQCIAIATGRRDAHSHSAEQYQWLCLSSLDQLAVAHRQLQWR